MSAAQGSSEELRQNGNGHYAAGKSARRVTDKRRHLWSALDCYKGALAAATEHKDRSFCCKNTAVTNKELAQMEWSEGNTVRAWDHLHNSLAAFSDAWRHSTMWTEAGGDEGRQWCSRFMLQFPEDLRAMYTLTLSQKSDKGLVDNLTRVCDVIGRYSFSNTEYLEVAANIFIDCANRLLHLSVTLDKKLHYGQAFSYIAKMHFPIREAERLLSRRNATSQWRETRALEVFEHELGILREDQRIQETVFRSRVELERGKDFLQNLGEQGQVTDEALLGMDGLRAALGLISEDGIDIVLEAEVCSNMGNLYLSVFHAECSAEKYFKRCIQLILCHLTEDRVIGCRSEPWYATAERGLRKLQELQATRHEDERRKQLEADGTLADIKSNFNQGIEHFLQYIYEKYPAVKLTPGEKPSSLDLDKPMKKRLTVALSHYHPDKVRDKQDRRKYYIFEEITKFLNVEFEKVK